VALAWIGSNRLSRLGGERVGRALPVVRKRELCSLAKVDRLDAAPAAAPAAEAEPEARSKPARLPAPESRNMEIDAMLAYWQGLAPQFQPRVTGYLYRLWPICDLKTLDPSAKTNIAKFTRAPESKKAILREFGTGEYDLKLTDLDQSRNGQICTSRFSFLESYADYPPILDVRTLDLNRKENRSYVEWLRATGKLGAVTGSNAGGATADTATAALAAGFQALLAELRGKKNSPESVDATLAQISQMYAGASKASVDMALAQVRQNSPADLVELIGKLQTAMHRPESEGPRMLELLMKSQADASKMLLEASNKNTELVLKLVEARSAGAGSIERTLETITAIRNAFGDGGRRGERWYHMFEPHLPTVFGTLDKFASALPLFARRPAAAPGQAAAVANPAAPGAPAGLPANPAMEARAQASFPAPVEDQRGGDMFQQFLMQIWVPMLSHLNQGARGEIFADFVAAGWGMTVSDHAAFRAMGRDRILGMIRAQPEAWRQIQPIEPQAIAFLDEFLAWRPNWAEEEEVAPPPSGPVDFGGVR
jgi:hypothetical protein